MLNAWRALSLSRAGESLVRSAIKGGSLYALPSIVGESFVRGAINGGGASVADEAAGSRSCPPERMSRAAAAALVAFRA